jgi:parvulin-like peptidyl-prolyl isomerase
MQKPTPLEDGKKHEWKQAGRAAARVGDEIITFHDLLFAVKEYRRRYQNAQPPTKEQLNDLASAILNNLIERSLLVQEAKRQIKNPKQIDKFMEMADRVWREEQLPPLQYRYAVETEQQLREKFKEEDRSLEAMHQNFRQDFLAQSFLHEKLKGRLKIELPDLLKYYNEHVGKHDFDRPAQITWRELVVAVGKSPKRDEALRRAEELLEKLRRGGDFAQLARTESDGPTSSRNRGGLMQTSPGGYAVTTVNAALETLPIGQVSGILEGPNSFHIVRVESRRAAGAATFAEVQDEIRPILSDKRFETERKALIAKLRQQTVISTIFDGTESDPNRAVR